MGKQKVFSPLSFLTVKRVNSKSKLINSSIITPLTFPLEFACACS